MPLNSRLDFYHFYLYLLVIALAFLVAGPSWVYTPADALGSQAYSFAPSPQDLPLSLRRCVCDVYIRVMCKHVGHEAVGLGCFHY